MSTENGANIGGDVDTGGGNFVGRDQFIQNIVVVGQFLDYAGIQNIISKPSVESVDFSKISDELIKDIKEQIPSDLATSLAFTGQIIKKFLEGRLQGKPFATVGTRDALVDLAQVVGKHLVDLNYWNTYCEVFKVFENGEDQYHDGIPLPLTENLIKVKFQNQPSFSRLHIGREEKYRENRFFFTQKGPLFVGNVRINTGDLSNPVCRVFMAGIVVDLIRLHSLSYTDTQFWNSVSKLLGI